MDQQEPFLFNGSQCASAELSNDDIYLSLLSNSESNPFVNTYFANDANILYQEDSSSPLSSPFLVLTEESMNVNGVPLNVDVLGCSEESSPSLSPETAALSSDDLRNTNMNLSAFPDTSNFAISESAIESLLQDVKTEEEEEEDKKPKKSRKRQRKDSSSNSKALDTDVPSPSDVSGVTLNRDQLLRFSSQDLDNFARQIASVRKLTSAEEKEIKRQRRLIKNRESAQASRERKKNYVDDLEGQMNLMKSDNFKLMEEVKQLKEENRSLKEEIRTLHSMLTKRIDAGIDKDSKISFGDLISISKKDTASISNKLKTAGVTLLIILFSFGLFFNNLHLQSPLPPTLSKAIAQKAETLIELNAVDASVLPRPRAGRNILFETPTEKSASIPKFLKTNPSPSVETSEPVPQSEGKGVPENELQEEAFKELIAAKRSDSSPIHKFTQLSEVDSKSFNSTSINSLIDRKRKLATLGKGTDSADMSSIFMSEFANESSNVDTKDSSALLRWFNDNIQPNIKQNTAYMACSDVQQIIPANSPPTDPSEPFFVSFLIPSGNGSNHNNIMMEVTCQVVDIAIMQGFSSSSSSSIPISLNA